MKFLIMTWSVTSFLLLCAAAVYADGEPLAMLQQTTVSPIANMSPEGDAMKAHSVVASSTEKTEKEVIKQLAADSKQHTIADFIIHPLIALKPRPADAEKGKQAAAASSSTPAPWQLFNFGPGQGLGSSVSSLAGTVTGWLGNRIQFPALVDTPVRESANTATATTTARPDIYVKIQKRPSKQKPSSNNNNRPYRRNKISNRFNVNYGDYSDENDYANDYDDVLDFNRKRINRRRFQVYEDDDYESDDHSADDDDDDVEQEEDETPVRQQVNGLRNRVRLESLNDDNIQRRRLQQLLQGESAEKDQYENDDDDEDADDDDDDDDDQHSKRSENELNFLQRGQQNLVKQLKQFARGQTPANSLRKSQMTGQNKRRQPAIILVNRRGQTFYLPSELLEVTDPDTPFKRYTPQLTQPANKRKPQPSQYAIIPWTQLGFSSHEQIVSQPLILQVPSNSKNNIQTPAANSKKPTTGGNGMPLVAEATLMDVFRPSRIAPTRSRTTIKTTPKPSTPSAVVAKVKPAPARISPVNVVEMAAALENSSESLEDDSDSSQYIVIGDESVAKKFTENNYRQILNYFKRNRAGRQLNDGTTAERKEQFIPVQIVTGDEEPFKDANTVKDNLQTKTEAVKVTDDSEKKVDEELEAGESGQKLEAVKTS